MKTKSLSGIILILLLTSMLTTAINIPPILADLRNAELSNSEGLNQNEPANENPSPRSINEDKWNFSRANEWADFAKVDENSAELVIGINHENPNSYADVTRLIGEKGGNLVNTVSMASEIRAVVADIPLTAMPSFVSEVRTANLSCYLEPNMKVQGQLVPNDPYWSMQWGPQKIEADSAWNTTIGSTSVLVAVVDTGIDYTHPDVAANYVDLGYDWVNRDAYPLDDHGHGTHCAGIIAAVMNNGVGIAGLAQVHVMAEKVLDMGGGGFADWIANGIAHAADCGADIISISLGGYSDSELIHEAVKYAYDAGALVIAAAGNDYSNMKMYPAGYDEVVAVAATDQYDSKASFSNWGDWIELAAPGVDIFSTIPGGYAPKSGTSMAAPHVSGVAALVWSRYPSKTRDWVRLWLRNTADDLGEVGFDLYYGYGRVNARKAVEQTPPEHEMIAYEWKTPPYVEPGATVIVNATILNFGGNNESDVTTQLLANGSMVDSTTMDFLASGNMATVSLFWNPVAEGLYNVTLYVMPAPGESVANNVLRKYIYVGFPVKSVVLHSAGNVYGDIITNWQVLNNEWHTFGDTMVYIDYETLNKEDISYEDIAATDADVLIISCAYDPYAGWEFTDSEIEAIERYVHEGHGLIATAGTFYEYAPNNKKLGPLFGINETIRWTSTGTDLLYLMNTTHPIFANVPDPLVFPGVGTAVPYDGRWDSNELAGGKYLALGYYQESAIVAFRGLVYLSPWLEIIPPRYHHHLQLLYNAITWSRYQKPEHELEVSLHCPTHLKPPENAWVNATVENMGSNNETNVKLSLLLDGAQVANLTVPTLAIGELASISYLWTPTTIGNFNITAYAPPASGEEEISNNVKTIFSRVSYAPVIGFIETHRESLHSDDLKIFYQGLGHIVTPIYSSLTPERLAGYDILIVGEDWSNFMWLPSEIAAVQDFVRSGKGFVAIGDELAFSVQEILAEYGVTYTGTYGKPGSSTNFDRSHPIMTDVNRFYASYPVNSLHAVPPAYWIANDAFNVQMLIAGAEVEGYVLCMSDDFAAYVYDDDNEIMFTNVVEWMAVKYEHDLAVSLEAPTSMEPNASVLLNATVRNHGLNNETSVELQLMISGTIVNSTIIPLLPTKESYGISHLWTPGTKEIYNVTAYASPVPNEGNTANNVRSKIVLVHYAPKLLVVDTPGSEDTGALDMLGYKYTLVSPTEFAKVDLYQYNVLFVGWEPGDIIVDALLYRASDIAYWVAAGNGIVALAQFNEINRWAWLPVYMGGSSGYHAETVHILNAAHPVMSRLTDPELTAWASSYHGYFISYDPSWEALAQGVEANHTITLATTYGAGRIAITDQDPDYHLYYQNKEGARKLLGNMIEWATPVRYDHEITVSLDVPSRLTSLRPTLLNATVDNRGLNNETNVELQLLVNGTIVDSVVVPELMTSSSHTRSYLWHPTIEGTYNVTAYAPPVLGENIVANNAVSKSIRVRYTAVALISDKSGLLVVSPILDSMGLSYDVYNDNSIHFYTEDLNLLLGYPMVIFNKQGRSITLSEHSALQAYLSSGNNLLVTGCDSLAYPDDWLLADIVRSSSVGDNVGEPDLYVVDETHPIMNGPYGSFPAGFHISGLNDDCDAAGADTARFAVTVAELLNGYDKIIATELSPGRVVYWNGVGADDWTANADCEAMLRNTLAWFGTPEIPGVYDAAIISVTSSATEAYEGQMVNVTVTAKNQGNITETFEVIAYYNTSVIGTQTVINLHAGANVTLTFGWNTKDVPLYINHTIWAQASIAPSETNTDNNVFVGGTIMIEMMGDVSGDKKVDGKDVAIIASAFGSYLGHLRWNIRSDLYRDGRIDGRDIAFASKNFGKTYP